MTTSIQLQTLAVRVTAVTTLTPLIKEFRLAPVQGATLPGFEAGAHIAVCIPGAQEQWRAYSLINFDPANDTSVPQAEYRIAVRYEAEGKGGSKHLHEKVAVGTELEIHSPANHFPLVPADHIQLFAGGIGITPIASMAASLKRAGKTFDLHYSGRSKDQMAYLDEVRALGAGVVHIYCDDEPDNALDVARLLAILTVNQPLYVCGPGGMIKALQEGAESRGWVRANVHYESFGEAAKSDGERAFDVVLKSSGRVVEVPVGKSMLDALLEANVEVIYDCRAGFCGLCAVGVLEGDIDHRDCYLLDDAKAAGNVMQACVSRANCQRLVVDL